MIRGFLIFLLMFAVGMGVAVSGAAAAPAKKPKKQEVFMPELSDSSVIIDSDNVPPEEPNLLQVKFMRLDPPAGISDRITRVVYGITKDIPPEYDHYGYEIRRYMAACGNARIYEDDSFLETQIKNVRKARVIQTYWADFISSESDEIEKLMETDATVTAVERTTFRNNRADARAFMIALQGWIDSNEKLLQSIYDLNNYYELSYPEVIFLRPYERIDYFNALQVRQVKLMEIQKYQPFSIMVY